MFAFLICTVLATTTDTDYYCRETFGHPGDLGVTSEAEKYFTATTSHAEASATIGEAGSQGSLAALHQLVLALGHRERTAATDAERAGWTLALGAAHHALAARGSRLARLDVRVALERSPPERLGELVAAAEAVGDAACLAPLAAAWTAGEGPTRARVAAAFSAIMTREGLTRRHAAVKDVGTRWPQAAVELLARRS